MTDQIEAYIDGTGAEIPFAVREEIGKASDYSQGRNRYIGYLISLATRSYKNVKVGLDCSNGSAFSIAKNVFDALGAKTYVINNEPDGTTSTETAAPPILRCCRSSWWKTAWTWASPTTGRGPVHCRRRERPCGGRRPDPLYLRAVHEGAGDAGHQHGGHDGHVQYRAL